MTDIRRPLTPQQSRVVDGIRRGRTNREIATELGISERTVESYVEEIMHCVPNPDHLRPRICILVWAHTRTSTVTQTE